MQLIGHLHTENTQKTIVRRKDKKFELAHSLVLFTEKALSAYKAYLLERDISDLRPESNLRISNFTTDGDNTSILLQPINYLDHVRTNLTMDFRSDKNAASIRELVQGESGLEPLGETSLADHIGIDVLLFTFDGHLIIGKRSSRRVAVTQGLLGPVGAGAMKENDVRTTRGKNLQEVDLLRELREEMNITKEDLDLSSFHILGIGRDMLRGGKPQLFIKVHTPLTFKDIKEKQQSAKTFYEHKKIIHWVLGRQAVKQQNSESELSELRARFSKYLKENKNRMTEPLLGALGFWWRERLESLNQ